MIKKKTVSCLLSRIPKEKKFRNCKFCLMNTEWKQICDLTNHFQALRFSNTLCRKKKKKKINLSLHEMKRFFCCLLSEAQTIKGCVHLTAKSGELWQQVEKKYRKNTDSQNQRRIIIAISQEEFSCLEFLLPKSSKEIIVFSV